MKKLNLLLLVLFSAISLNINAYDFEAVNSDGTTIYYEILSETDLTVEVTYRSSYANYDSGDINIPSSVSYNGEIYSVTSIGMSAFSNCSGLTSITIPNSVTSIGEEAFYGCTGLTSITIGDSVTSIEDDAFRNCSGLTSITIPNSVTSIGNSAFYNCSGLTSITIPNSVTSIGNSAFNSCSKLTEINVDLENSNFSSIDGVLFNKDKTELIKFP
ncbi:MAG: leucine-rich repeat domain-containing protein, partial [Bacteroidaceae bacterium]|nr:leucine-rich repeat domain-containing protein [Bacteroidaceae bacterium]